MPFRTEENDRDVCAGEKRNVGARDVIFRWKHFGRLDLIQLLSHLARVCRLQAFDETTQAKPRLHLGFLPPEVRSFYSAD